MRRHLGAILTITSLTLLVAACSASNSETSATGSGGVMSSTGTGGSSGAGGTPQPSASESSLTADTESIMACNAGMKLFAPVHLSLPDARAMASAAQVRGLLFLPPSGVASPPPPPSLVRGDEIFNYYHVNYPVPASSEPTVVTELVATDKLGDYLLQIAVVAPTTTVMRRPTSVTVLVDTSASMAGDSISRANAALQALATSLNKGDVLTFLTTDPERAPVRRRAMSAGDPALFNAQVDKLDVGGEGRLGRALERAYQEATSTDGYIEGGLNRVVVITDGSAPAIDTSTPLIGDRWSGEQIQLVGVGVGNAAAYRNDLLAAATTFGHGPSLYLDSVDEADAALHQRFDEVMDVAARDVSITVQLPWVFKAMSATTMNPVSENEELILSDLGRGRTMIFRRPVTLCNGVDIAVAGDLPIDVTATWTSGLGVNSLPSKVPFSTPVKTALLDHASPQMLKASALLAFANALQALDGGRLQDACNKVLAARAASQPSPNSPAVDAELESILKQINAHPLRNGKPCQ